MPQTAIRRVRVIVNPTSGKGDRPILQPLHRMLTEMKIEYDLHIQKRAGEAHQLAKTAADDYDAVIVYGGDGTVNEAMTALMGTTTPLVIIPGGTVNVLAVELGIPTDVEAALQLLGGDHDILPVDALRVEVNAQSSYSIVRLSIGYLAEVVKATNRDLKDKLGQLAHTVTTLKTLDKFASILFTLTIDGEQYQAEGATCMIANTANIGTSGVTLDAAVRVDDGLLDVLILPANVGGLASIVASLVGSGSLMHWQGRSVTISAEPPAAIECDGEDAGMTPITVSIVPAAVRVFRPSS